MKDTDREVTALQTDAHVFKICIKQLPFVRVMSNAFLASTA